MIYFDTSYLAKCYLQEWGSQAVRELAATQGEIACSALGRLELVAAFHRKLREGAINRSDFQILLNQLELDDSQSLWTWLPLTPELLHSTTKRFLGLPEHSYVRSADAIHLNAAYECGVTSIFSNDSHLLAAVAYFGLRGENVIE